MTRAEDAAEASRLGVDAIGLVFWKQSKRALTDLAQAADIAAACHPLVSVVGLFVDASEDWVHQVLDRVPVSLLQFHGNESPEFCRSFDRPFIKALRMKEDADAERELLRFHGARGMLLDTFVEGAPGGTGESFDWQRFPSAQATRLILAGGLNASNVAGAIATSGAHAVDVSGGIESAPGIKDAQRMRDFMAAVRSMG